MSTVVQVKKLPVMITCLLVLSLVLAGCGAPAQPTASEPPTATPRSAAPTQTDAPADSEPTARATARATATEAAATDGTNGEPVAISVSGAFALFPMMTVWAEEYSRLNPNVTFDVQGGGAGKGMTDMLTGAADIAMLSRDVRPEELDQGAFLVPAAIDAVVPTINANNPVLADLLATGLTPEKAATIWLTQTTTTWGALIDSDDTSALNVYTRSDSSGAAEVWAKFLGGTAQEELQGTGVNGDPAIAEAVRQDPLGIGYNNIAFAYDLTTGQQVEGIRVIPIDLNGDGEISPDEDFYDTRESLNQAVAERRYPYPPARLLYLVTKGEPSAPIAAFYEWMLTEGQDLVNEAGFVGLNQETIDEGLATLGQPTASESPTSTPRSAASRQTETPAETVAPTTRATTVRTTATVTATEEAATDGTNGEPVALSVSGAFALFPMMTVWAEEYSRLNPNVTFDVQGGGAGKGMTDMLTGAADIAMLSRDVRPEEVEQGAVLMPAAIDAVVLTVNADNPFLDALLATGLTPEQGAAIWLTQETTTWGALIGSDDTTAINVYTRSDSSGAAEVWAKFLGGTAQEELQGTGVNGDPAIAEAVRQDPLGIGYNNIAFAYDLTTGQQVEGIRVIPIDLNGDGQISPDEDFYATRESLNQAVKERRYPYPPARLLYLVTKGEPSPPIAAFYEWMLSDGQNLVNEAGFVGLNQESIDEGLATLAQR